MGDPNGEGQHPYFDLPRPVVLGHRGAAGTVPENTLESFAAALEAGATVIESDVHVTRDGVPVLLHDPEVDRVADATGPVSGFDWTALSRLDAAHRFHGAEERAPETVREDAFRGQGFRIPSLEQAFARFPETRFNLEIKCHDAAAIQATLDLVARFDRAARTLLAAGEDPIMKDLRAAVARHACTPAMGASVTEIVAAVTSALGQGDMPEGVMALQIPAAFAGKPLATPELVRHAHAHGVEVHVWTINDLDEIAALVDLGVDGIVTDYPGRMNAWIRDRMTGPG